MRVCEYCDVKIENPQVDESYQLGRKWREIDKEMLRKKIDWYKSKQNTLKEENETHKEALQLEKATFERELQKVEDQRQGIQEQKEFQEGERDKVLAQCSAKDKYKEELKNKID